MPTPEDISRTPRARISSVLPSLSSTPQIFDTTRGMMICETPSPTLNQPRKLASFSLGPFAALGSSDVRAIVVLADRRVGWRRTAPASCHAPESPCCQLPVSTVPMRPILVPNGDAPLVARCAKDWLHLAGNMPRRRRMAEWHAGGLAAA